MIVPNYILHVCLCSNELSSTDSSSEPAPLLLHIQYYQAGLDLIIWS